MLQEFREAQNLIDTSQNILLTMHERMDGDDGGSILALAQELMAQKKNVTVAIKKGVPPNLSFLPGADLIKDNIGKEEGFDLLITCGCSTLDRCGSENIIKLQAPILNIDHHPDNTLFGQVNLVDPEKSSVAELVFDFFNFCKWKITKNIAVCLLTGIITDTGSFMHSNTRSSTLEAAAKLMKRGAQISQIIGHTFKGKTPQILKAWGRALQNSYYDDKHKIIYSVITEKDLSEIGQLPHSAFEGLAETLNTIPQAKFAMFLRQEGPIIKGSLRSDIFKNADVAKIAKLFGGGGHKLAAGFSVAGKLSKEPDGKWKII
jgi:phosphoesterase RecJ-like protein